jgi:hypothetical protein
MEIASLRRVILHALPEHLSVQNQQVKYVVRERMVDCTNVVVLIVNRTASQIIKRHVSLLGLDGLSVIVGVTQQIHVVRRERNAQVRMDMPYVQQRRKTDALPELVHVMSSVALPLRHVRPFKLLHLSTHSRSVRRIVAEQAKCSVRVKNLLLHLERIHITLRYVALVGRVLMEQVEDHSALTEILVFNTTLFL